MTKLTVLFAGLLALAACNSTGAGMNTFPSNEAPVEQIAQPTDGFATNM